MSIGLALADAANNCAQQRAKVVLTLKSGIQIEGFLKKDNLVGTVQVEHSDGGWETVDVDEIAAVRSKPGDRARSW